MGHTTVTIVSELTGTYWWPAGEEWTKDVCETFARTPADVHTLDEVSTLREAVERICNDGDSQSAPLLDGSGYVEISRTSDDGRRTRIRRYTLDQFGSVSDYLVPR
jgi:hypothetical protein